MKTLFIFISVIIFICVYIIFYHKIDTNNFLDVIHTGFIRQFIFELIPFIILFGVRDLKFIDISNTGNFFGSLVGRSILGMIGFTFVSYAVTTVSPKKTPAMIPLQDTIQNVSQKGGRENLNQEQKSFTDTLPMFNSGIEGNEKLLSYHLLQ
jgi:hypothetical protein